jgi:hypothetical protein
MVKMNKAEKDYTDTARARTHAQVVPSIIFIYREDIHSSCICMRHSKYFQVDHRWEWIIRRFDFSEEDFNIPFSWWWYVDWRSIINHTFSTQKYHKKWISIKETTQTYWICTSATDNYDQSNAYCFLLSCRFRWILKNKTKKPPTVFFYSYRISNIGWW